ncbi:hypothetical protein CEXT_383611 [Caerostris extrusa]|uniref:Uncharacterized protein n=1 Tax=Caerostris extrusa TaxID=172846 RepID=A0AAV4MT38_CAEEX|nr:hypothetical protein CEXT_383611 [Caerostris extrusa]
MFNSAIEPSFSASDSSGGRHFQSIKTSWENRFVFNTRSCGRPSRRRSSSAPPAAAPVQEECRLFLREEGGAEADIFNPSKLLEKSVRLILDLAGVLREFQFSPSVRASQLRTPSSLQLHSRGNTGLFESKHKSKAISNVVFMPLMKIKSVGWQILKEDERSLQNHLAVAILTRFPLRKLG